MIMSSHEQQEKADGNKYIIEAKKYMQQNYYRSVSICEVAEMLHISDRYLYNLFIKYEKVSPKKHLNDLRLNRARELLKNHNMSVTEIATSVGFDDVLVFSKFFKKNMCISPTKYRKMTFEEWGLVVFVTDIILQAREYLFVAISKNQDSILLNWFRDIIYSCL